MSRRHHDTLDADVVVVGARCAGAATAMLLAAAGHDVLLVDRATFPSDTLSTHAIARSGVVQLNRWGLLPAVLDAGTPPIREVVFHAAARSVPRTVKDRMGVDMLVAPRRHVLDALLVDARRGRRRAADDRRDASTACDAATTAGSPVCVAGTTAAGSTSGPGSSSAPTGCARGSPAASAPRSPRSAGAGSGAAHYAYFAGDWPAMEYYVGDRAVRRGLPDERRRGLRLGVLSGRRRQAFRRCTPHDRRRVRRHARVPPRPSWPTASRTTRDADGRRPGG